MQGLSAAAWSGMSCMRLVEVAQFAGKLISFEFEAINSTTNP
jgi:TetR/AcrR family transcriptional repressor for divergent bdcA